MEPLAGLLWLCAEDAGTHVVSWWLGALSHWNWRSCLLFKPHSVSSICELLKPTEVELQVAVEDVGWGAGDAASTEITWPRAASQIAQQTSASLLAWQQSQFIRTSIKLARNLRWAYFLRIYNYSCTFEDYLNIIHALRLLDWRRRGKYLSRQNGC